MKSLVVCTPVYLEHLNTRSPRSIQTNQHRELSSGFWMKWNQCTAAAADSLTCPRYDSVWRCVSLSFVVSFVFFFFPLSFMPCLWSPKHTCIFPLVDCLPHIDVFWCCPPYSCYLVFLLHSTFIQSLSLFIFYLLFTTPVFGVFPSLNHCLTEKKETLLIHVQLHFFFKCFLCYLSYKKKKKTNAIIENQVLVQWARCCSQRELFTSRVWSLILEFLLKKKEHKCKELDWTQCSCFTMGGWEAC